MFAMLNKNILRNTLLSINESGFDAMYMDTGTRNTPRFVSKLILFALNSQAKITPTISESSLYKDVERISLKVSSVLIAALTLKNNEMEIIEAIASIMLIFLFFLASKNMEIRIGNKK